MSQYHSLGDQEVWNFARSEGVTSIIGHTLIRLLGENNTPYSLINSVRNTESRISLYMEQLDLASTALAKSDIKLVALKNSGIARGLHTALATTPMGDVDVLVSPKDFLHAHQILEGLGFRLDDRSPFDIANIEHAELHGGSEYRVDLLTVPNCGSNYSGGPLLAVGFDLIKSRVSMNSRAIFTYFGSSAPSFYPEDNLLQVCLHTAKHSFVRAPGFAYT